MRQARKITTVQRNRGHPFRRQRIAGLRRFRLQNRREIPDLHRLRSVTHFERHVHTRDLVHFESEGTQNRLLETLIFRRDRVLADRKKE